MKTSIYREIPLLLFTLAPIAYLWIIWPELPDSVPMHWNARGEIDRWGDKSELIYLVILLPGFIYGLMSVIPLIDPKKKIDQMGNKFQQLKFYLMAFISLLTIYIIYSSQKQGLSNVNIVFILIGLLYLVLGNYFQSIKANYFIGIRTPWTLENESVWRDTHKMAGRIWLVGGLLVVFACLLLPQSLVSTAFLSITVVMALIPIIYSYLRFRQLEKE